MQKICAKNFYASYNGDGCGYDVLLFERVLLCITETHFLDLQEISRVINFFSWIFSFGEGLRQTIDGKGDFLGYEEAW